MDRNVTLENKTPRAIWIQRSNQPKFATVYSFQKVFAISQCSHNINFSMIKKVASEIKVDSVTGMLQCNLEEHMETDG